MHEEQKAPVTVFIFYNSDVNEKISMYGVQIGLFIIDSFLYVQTALILMP